MTKAEFLQKIKSDPRFALEVIICGNRPGVLRVLKAYQIKVDENATDEDLVNAIIQGGKACEACLAEVMLLRINTELLPDGYAEALQEAGMLDVTKNLSGTKSTLGSSSFDKTQFQGDTVTVNGILYTWNPTLKMYVMGSPEPSGSSDQETNTDGTEDTDPRLNWNNIITGGFGTVTAIFSSGVFGNKPETQTNTTTDNSSDDKKGGNWKTILIALFFIALAIGLVYYFKNRG